MSANINTVTFLGIEARDIDVQVHISGGGLPAFNIVGLADKSIAESRERVRAAFASIGLAFPAKRITINLAPADVLKDGSHFDLGIAAGLLVAMGIIPQDEISRFVVMGELALDGSVRPVHGVLPAGVVAGNQGRAIICPEANVPEALYSGSKVLGCGNLLQLIQHFSGKHRIAYADFIDHQVPPEAQYPDLADVQGQSLAKRALEIAAAGRHHMLMIGQPGSGKSMLAKRLPGIMPPLSIEERLEISIIASISGLLHEGEGLIHRRPFRTPHCSSSMAAMVGGGKNVKPGEITLAHGGILFLDELPEFARNVIESLRQPIEDGYISIARVNTHVRYPAKFQLIAAMNPCRCGYYGSANPQLTCRKAPQCVYDYQDRISGPMFDRFDLQVETDAVNPMMSQEKTQVGESSAAVQARVVRAHKIQAERYARLGLEVTANSELDGENLREVVVLEESAKELLHQAVMRFTMSMRAVNRVLKVAQTIADLDAHDGHLTPRHVAEALSYRINRIKC